ncbi:hypothetical protein [Acetivibrio saccincola]|uniref:Uncharacterized protein n=1 Tax=Acetivibrio saccincola TaxID=1677857 RepID=A0A2K9E2F4_9FIRM|nr:hypothetical protein [Acetivibrio saccincola]AUG57937.1 hypothetical protein HVS_10200 [Acetivibrio saccincola]
MISQYKNYPNYDFFKEKIEEETKSANSKNMYSEKRYNTRNILKEINEIVERKSFIKFFEYEIPFPLKYPALKINESVTKLDNLKCTMFKSGVLVEGDIKKEIVFFTPENKYMIRYKDKHLDTCFSSIKSITTNIPFQCFGEFKEIDKEYVAEVESASVDREDVVDILSKPFTCSICGEKLFRMLKEKIVIKISVILLKKNYVYL